MSGPIFMFDEAVRTREGVNCQWQFTESLLGLTSNLPMGQILPSEQD